MSQISVSEILELCQEDPESILYNLGFAGEQPQPATKIPTRFFQVPSQLKGINFRMFLEAQVQRMELEDPCLLLANRFRQVETLMTTANAFYCLYSYVSKTPVQKIAPSYSFMDHGDIPDIMITSPKPQPVSPIDRLKRAVCRMCLYSPSRDRDTPPKANLDPKRNLSRWDLVVQEVLEKVREDKREGKQKDISASNGPVKTIASSEQPLVSRGEAWPVKLTKTSAVASNELKSKVLKARALPNCPTERLPSATMADQPAQTMRMAQTLEERSPPTGPEKRLKSQRKLYFFPEEDLSLTQHECDAGMSAVETSNVSTEAVKTWPPNEPLPTDSYTNCQSALNTEDRLGNIKSADVEASMHTQNRGSCSDSWSSTLCKSGQTEYQEHNCGFQLISASSHDTKLIETSKRTLVGVISDDHETGTNLCGSTSGNVHDISENVPFWQTSTCAWAANSAVHSSDCCRDGLTTSSVRETKEQIISGPIFSNRASKRYQGIVESATLDCTRPSEHTWTLFSSVETSPARRTCLQENSFEMEEVAGMGLLLLLAILLSGGRLPIHGVRADGTLPEEGVDKGASTRGFQFVEGEAKRTILSEYEVPPMTDPDPEIEEGPDSGIVLTESSGLLLTDYKSITQNVFINLDATAYLRGLIPKKKVMGNEFTIWFDVHTRRTDEAIKEMLRQLAKTLTPEPIIEGGQHVHPRNMGISFRRNKRWVAGVVVGIMTLLSVVGSVVGTSMNVANQISAKDLSQRADNLAQHISKIYDRVHEQYATEKKMLEVINETVIVQNLQQKTLDDATAFAHNVNIFKDNFFNFLDPMNFATSDYLRKIQSSIDSLMKAKIPLYFIPFNSIREIIVDVHRIPAIGVQLKVAVEMGSALPIYIDFEENKLSFIIKVPIVKLENIFNTKTIVNVGTWQNDTYIRINTPSIVAYQNWTKNKYLAPKLETCQPFKGDNYLCPGKPFVPNSQRILCGIQKGIDPLSCDVTVSKPTLEELNTVAIPVGNRWLVSTRMTSMSVLNTNLHSQKNIDIAHKVFFLYVPMYLIITIGDQVLFHMSTETVVTNVESINIFKSTNIPIDENLDRMLEEQKASSIQLKLVANDIAQIPKLKLSDIDAEKLSLMQRKDGLSFHSIAIISIIFISSMWFAVISLCIIFLHLQLRAGKRKQRKGATCQLRKILDNEPTIIPVHNLELTSPELS